MNNSVVFPVNICRTLVQKRPDPDTLALSVSKTVKVSEHFSTSADVWYQSFLGPNCLGSEVSEHPVVFKHSDVTFDAVWYVVDITARKGEVQVRKSAAHH